MTAQESLAVAEEVRSPYASASLEEAKYGDGIRFWAPRLIVIGLLIAGGYFAYQQDAVTLTDGTGLSLKDARDKITFAGDGWVFTLTWFGALLAVASSLFMPHRERFAQCLATSFGAVLAMAFPFYVSRNLSTVNPDADSLGSGLTFAWICFAIAAAVPWTSTLLVNREDSLFGKDWSKWLFLLPAVGWILMLTVFPLTYALTTSRYQYRNGLVSRFVEWDNYRRLFAREWTWSPLVEGLIYALVAAAVVMAITAIYAYYSEREVDRSDLRHGLSLVPVISIPVFMIVALPGILRDPVDNAFDITVFFVGVAVTVEMFLGFGTAILLNRELKARGLLRATIILPLFAAPVGIGYLGRTIFFEEGGPVNSLLEGIGLNGQPWLSNPFWSKISTIIADVWLWTPFVFVIALAGLQALPEDIQEASEVDGSNTWQGFKNVTLPLMAPIMWLILFLRVIDAFKVFDIAASMTVGGPGRATEYYSYLTYRTARRNFNYGDAAAQAFLLLFVVSVLIIVLWTRVKSVYEEEWK